MFEEKTLSSRPIFEGRAFSVRVDTIINSAGLTTTREIVEHAECIAVVAVNQNAEILLVKQYRKAVEEILLEIPAGGIEKDESPEMAVKRELQEEIGFLPQKIRRLGGFYTSPGFCTEFLHIYLASELMPNQLWAEDTDAIQTFPIQSSQIMNLIESGQIKDAKSISGLLLYLSSGLK